jgi:hypothetical protein
MWAVPWSWLFFVLLLTTRSGFGQARTATIRPVVTQTDFETAVNAVFTVFGTTSGSCKSESSHHVANCTVNPTGCELSGRVADKVALFTYIGLILLFVPHAANQRCTASAGGTTNIIKFTGSLSLYRLGFSLFLRGDAALTLDASAVNGGVTLLTKSGGFRHFTLDGAASNLTAINVHFKDAYNYG